VPVIETVLSLPADGLHLFAQAFLALAQRWPDVRPEAIAERRFTNDAPQMRITRLGYGTATCRAAA